MTPRDLAATLARLPRRRDFAFSAELGRAAWIDGDVVAWHDDGTPGSVFSAEPGVVLPEGTLVELVDQRHIGLCRPIDAGVELLVLDTTAPDGPVAKIAALATPRTSLLPRLSGVAWQLLAVTGFEEVTALLRIDWAEGTWSEVGRLPIRIDGGVWLDAGRRLLLNVLGDSGRSSVHAVDLEAGRFSPFFEVSPETDDRALLLDPGTGFLVVTTDAPGWPAVGVKRLGDPAPLRFLPALDEGDESTRPLAFVGPAENRRLLLHHEAGPWVRLRTADLTTLEISEPLPVPDGEVGRAVATDGSTVRLAFSASDQPWQPGRLDLAAGRFHLDLAAPDPTDGSPIQWQRARTTTFPGPAGPMPALVYDPPEAGDRVLVALHGGPIARWGSEFQAELQLFCQLGFQVIALDYPGSTGSGRRYTNSLLGTAGELDVRAVTAVLDALGPVQTVLYGESYGAFLALAVASVREVAGVVSFAPFKSFTSLKAHGSPEVRETLKLLDRGNSDKPGRNLVKGCRTVRSKVLIAHGTADLTIPVGESRDLTRALRNGRNAGDAEVRLVEFEGQGHDLADRHVLEHWYRELAGFAGGLPVSGSPAQRGTSSRGVEQAASRTSSGREVEPHVRAHHG